MHLSTGRFIFMMCKVSDALPESGKVVELNLQTNSSVCQSPIFHKWCSVSIQYKWTCGWRKQPTKQTQLVEFGPLKQNTTNTLTQHLEDYCKSSINSATYIRALPSTPWTQWYENYEHDNGSLAKYLYMSGLMHPGCCLISYHQWLLKSRGSSIFIGKQSLLKSIVTINSCQLCFRHKTAYPVLLQPIVINLTSTKTFPMPITSFWINLSQKLHNFLCQPSPISSFSNE